MKRFFRLLLAICLLILPGSAVLHAEGIPPTQAKIAVIDTGVRRDRLPQGSSIDVGFNYVVEGGDTEDLVGHGTRIASLILGLIPEATLVPLVYYTKYPSGVGRNGGVEAICRAIYDAIDIYGCRILNLGSGIREDDPGLKAAIEYAESNGVIVIAAVGNDRVTAPDTLFYPASYETVIGVGAVREDHGIASFSQQNVGVTVVAPGTDLEVLSIQEGVEAEMVSGTSYATSYVSAYALLYLSLYPETSPAEFRIHLAEVAVDLGDLGYDETFGWGYIGPDTEQASSALQRTRRIEAMGFSDVASTDWYSDAVLGVWGAGLMLGESSDSFGPDKDITWEMLDTIQGRYRRIQEDCQTCDEEQPLLVPGLIRPPNADAPVTREEFCVVACHLGSVDAPPIESELTLFLDIEEVEDWARDYVLAAGAAGLFQGDNQGRFRPKGAITRAEAATVFFRLLGLKAS